MATFDKEALRQVALSRLEEELSTLREAAEATRRAATHEESRPENDKDTRGLEASYLARGQAKRVAETEEALHLIRQMALREFAEDSLIAISALVTVDLDEIERLYFLVPGGGGREIETQGTKVQLINPASPLGRALLNKRVGDDFELRIGGARREYEILQLE